MGRIMRVFEVKLMFEPKTYDIDYAGIVSNQVYIRWLEDMRIEVIRQHFGWENFPPAIVPVLLRTEIEYKKALKLFDKVEGRMWVSGLDNVRLFLDAEFIRGAEREEIAVAKHTVVFFDINKNRPVRIPGELKKAILAYKSGS